MKNVYIDWRIYLLSFFVKILVLNVLKMNSSHDINIKFDKITSDL